MKNLLLFHNLRVSDLVFPIKTEGLSNSGKHQNGAKKVPRKKLLQELFS